MKKRIEIFFTEDQKLFREAMIPMLESSGINTIGEASNGEELLKLLQKKLPDIILLDLQMPKMDGNKVLQIIKQKYPNVKIIVLTSFEDPSLKEDFKNKGVNAFLTKNTDLHIIIETIRNVSLVKNYTNIPEKNKSRFTKREIQIIPLICSGKTTKQIAEILDLSEKTVEANRHRLFEKTRCKNVVEFCTYCTKEGLEFLG